MYQKGVTEMHTASFVIEITKKRRVGDILKEGKYDVVNLLVMEGIQKRKLVTQDLSLGKRKMVLLWSDDNISSQEVLAEASRRRLVRPTHGDAFLFGEHYPEEQRGGEIVFLHDPQYSWSGHLFNLILKAERGRRIISLTSSGGWWHGGCRFVFIEK